MAKKEPIERKTIEQFIQIGLDELIRGGKLVGKKPKESYLDKYKIKLKKKRLKTALRSVNVKDKYRKFLGATTKAGKAYGPVSADGMDSGLAIGGGGEVGEAGWGAGGYAVRGFGEAINRNAKVFLQFVDRLKKKNTDPKLLRTVADGYKAIFNNIEDQSSAIVCGFQPSLREYMTFNIKDFVFALNNYSGEIVSIYIGEYNGMEPVSIIKRWYKDIGIDEDVIDRILFIEKATTEMDESMLDLPFKKGTGDMCITSNNDIEILINPMNNPILIGCADLYFLPDLMLNITKQEKKFQIDKNFMFLV